MWVWVAVRIQGAGVVVCGVGVVWVAVRIQGAGVVGCSVGVGCCQDSRCRCSGVWCGCGVGCCQDSRCRCSGVWCRCSLGMDKAHIISLKSETKYHKPHNTSGLFFTSSENTTRDGPQDMDGYIMSL